MKHRGTTKIVYTVLCLSFLTLQEGYSQTFNVNDKDINLSVGYGTPWVFREGYKTNMLPVGLSFDYGLSDRLGPGIISIGAYLGATSYSEEMYNASLGLEYGRKATLVAFALRSTYHYQLVDYIDTYAWLLFGMGYESWNSYGDVPWWVVLDLENKYRPVVGLGAGARYYFTDLIAAMVEIGYGPAFFKLGLSFKL